MDLETWASYGSRKGGKHGSETARRAETAGQAGEAGEAGQAGEAGEAGEARQAEIGEFEWRPGREAPAASGEERCPLPWSKSQVAAQLLAEGKPVRDIAMTFKVHEATIYRLAAAS